MLRACHGAAANGIEKVDSFFPSEAVRNQPNRSGKIVRAIDKYTSTPKQSFETN